MSLKTTRILWAEVIGRSNLCSGLVEPSKTKGLEWLRVLTVSHQKTLEYLRLQNRYIPPWKWTKVPTKRREHVLKKGKFRNFRPFSGDMLVFFGGSDNHKLYWIWFVTSSHMIFLAGQARWAIYARSTTMEPVLFYWEMSIKFAEPTSS